MTPEQRIENEIKARGITIRFLSEKTGISYGRLHPTVKGKREFRADEFLTVCSFLKIDPRPTSE